MGTDEYGAIIDVSTSNVGVVFAADAAIAATVITLDDVSPFEELGGQVYIDGTTYYYESVDHDANTMTLLVGLVAAATAEETRVEVFPPAPRRTAMVAFGIEEGEAVRVTIPHFFSGVPDGVRPSDAQEIALVEERNPGELFLKDVMAKGMTLLGLAENLDDYTSTGNFMQLYDSAAAGGTNYPVPYGGVLEVLSTQPSDIILQRYTAYRNDWRIAPSVWTRTFGAAAWSVWMPEQDDTGWIDTIASVAVASTGWSINSASVRRVNKTVFFVMDVLRTGTALAAPQATSNIAAAPIAQMVAAYRPGALAPDQAIGSSGNRVIGGFIGSTGIVTLESAAGTATIATNDTLTVGGSYLLD